MTTYEIPSFVKIIYEQFMLPMEKSVTLTGACANEIIPSINRSFVYKVKEERNVRILVKNIQVENGRL
jgi:hypothetical protein